MQPQLMSLRGEVEALQSEIAYFEGLPRMYVVEKGDFLYKIAEMDEIYADPLKWKRIYRANKDVLDGFSDPNLIYPDWDLDDPARLAAQLHGQGGREPLADRRRTGRSTGTGACGPTSSRPTTASSATRT